MIYFFGRGYCTSAHAFNVLYRYVVVMLRVCSLFTLQCMSAELYLRMSICPASLPFSGMGSGFPLPSGVYTLAEVTRRRREQQYIDDNLFNHKSRAAMMVNVATAMMQQQQVGTDHRSQRLSSLPHSGRTRTPVLMSGTSAPV